MPHLAHVARRTCRSLVANPARRKYRSSPMPRIANPPLATISASSSDDDIRAAFQTGAFFIDRVDASVDLLDKAEKMFSSGAYKNMERDGWRGYFPSDLEVTNPYGGLADSKIVCKFGGGGEIKSPADKFFNSPNVYPAVDSFQDTFERFTTEMRSTMGKVYAMAEKAFGIKLLHIPFVNLSNTIKYAASTNPVGIGEHTDYETLAVVMASEGTAADLQVRLPGGTGEWVTVEVADKPVVLVGELLELLTQGQAPAVPHRVVVHPQGTDRHSMTFFTLPDLNSFVDLSGMPFLTSQRPDSGFNVGHFELACLSALVKQGTLYLKPEHVPSVVAFVPPRLQETLIDRAVAEIPMGHKAEYRRQCEAALAHGKAAKL